MEEDSILMKSQGKRDFPKFSCICELCNCGRHKHHKGCRKRNAETRIIWGSDSCLLSHYRATFTWPHKRKRSGRRPQLSLVQLALPPTNQQGGQYLFNHPPQLVNRGSPKSLQAWSVQNLTTRPVQSERPAVPDTNRLQNASAQGLFRRNVTTSYQHHKGAAYSHSFPRLGELPAVIGSVLYPDEREKMETTNNREFVPKTGGRPERKQVVQGNLILEGERNLATTHREEFKPYPLEGAPVTRRQWAPVKEEENKGVPMESVTRYSHDFSPSTLPKRRNPARPHPDNLMINPALRGEFRTVQMDTYPGWNTLEHRRAAPAKFREELSVRSTDHHFQGDTVTKLDFQPIPLPSTRHKPQPMMTTLKPLQGQFDDRTANKESFKDWGVCRRVRHGDRYDGLTCVKPTGKFESETTNSQTFVQKKAERVRNCKPEEIREEDRGEQTFSTEHREAYRPLSLPVCQLQLYLDQNLPTSQGQPMPPSVKT
ncbi:hypothetical protein SKAU_G00326690 [Synaphobranchus kaupii]|uniref:Uncharacterized protein n=1 Tax=Synaphobranchus kaupii TaxID=118154 RepID=A0A9Q1EPY9_SYNKA|nr:hypothetical protein SKAU_G00326690 [Synaphobranchus kaupii]